MEIIKLDIPKGLQSKIITKLKRKEFNRIRFSIFGFGTFFTMFGAVFYAVSKELASSFVTNGVMDYISLFFSDTSVISESFANFAILIAGSIPVTETLVALTMLFVLVWSFGELIRRTNNFFLYKNKLKT